MHEQLTPVAADDEALATVGEVARLVEYAPGRLIALPPHTTLEVVEYPKPIAVPGAAYYAYGLLAWQEQRLPLINLHSLLKAHAPVAEQKPPRYALVVAWQGAPGKPVQYGAIGMAQLPESVRVADSAFCSLPDDSDIWPLISLSCFWHEGRPVPVVDTGRLFSAFHG